MKKRFEYKIVEVKPKSIWTTKLDVFDGEKELNRYGSDGWELVAVESRDYGGSSYGFYYTFKREI